MSATIATFGTTFFYWPSTDDGDSMNSYLKEKKKNWILIHIKFVSKAPTFFFFSFTSFSLNGGFVKKCSIFDREN